jgi:hypothetical protein
MLDLEKCHVCGVHSHFHSSPLSEKPSQQKYPAAIANLAERARNRRNGRKIGEIKIRGKAKTYNGTTSGSHDQERESKLKTTEVWKQASDKTTVDFITNNDLENQATQ